MSAGTHDIRIALRFLRRNSTFTVAAAAILALGISLGSTLFAIVRGALLEPWPYRDYDRIVTLAGNYPTQGRSGFSLWSVPEIEDLRAARDVFADVIAGDARNVNLTYGGRAERVRAAVITPNAFTLLGVPAMIGRPLTEADLDRARRAAGLRFRRPSRVADLRAAPRAAVEHRERVGPIALSTLLLVTLALVATAVPAWRAVHDGGLDTR